MRSRDFRTAPKRRGVEAGGEEEEEDEAREAEAENQADEATDAVDYQPKNRRQRLHNTVAGQIQLRQSSEAVPPTREVSLLQHRELHFLFQKCA
ncbi:hypothetical protein HKD37_05G012088 [Glycine soja]